MPEGPWAGRISVGVFAARELAERRSAEVGALGLETRVVRRDRAEGEHWLDLSTPYMEPDLVNAIRTRLEGSERLRELHAVPRPTQ